MDKRNIVILPITFQDEFLMIYNQSLEKYEFPKLTLKDDDNIMQKFSFFYEVSVKEIKQINQSNSEELDIYLAFHSETKNHEKNRFARISINQALEMFENLNFEEMKLLLKDYYAYKSYLKYLKEYRKHRIQNQNLRNNIDNSISLK